MRPNRVAWLSLFILGATLAALGVWLATRPQTSPDAGTNSGTANTSQDSVNREAAALIVAVFPLVIEANEALLQACIGKPAREVVQLLGLGEAKWFWTDEPPGILRGVSYFPDDERSVKLYIAEGEPLFREFRDRGRWDYEAFLACRVGGIQYKSGGVVLDVGPAVPWQWRRPRSPRTSSHRSAV
jgi:hypothetical protein